MTSILAPKEDIYFGTCPQCGNPTVTTIRHKDKKCIFCECGGEKLIEETSSIL